eukprot:13760010-Heterocapsa_arctica.AAC.1
MAELMEEKNEEVQYKAVMQRLRNAECSLQGVKGQEEALKSVRSQMADLQKKASESSDKSREAIAQSLLAKKLNKGKKLDNIKEHMEDWKS